MSSNNVAHVSSVDKGLKMKIKRTKVASRLDSSKHEVVKTPPGSGSAVVSVGSTVSNCPSTFSLVTSSRVSGSLTTAQSVSTSITASVTLPSSLLLSLSSSSPCMTSSSVLSSSTGLVVTSQVTMTVTNPTVSLLKAGVPLDPASRCQTKSWAAPGGMGSDSSKSPKSKAAYNKKGKDNKTKTEVPAGAACPTLAGQNPALADQDIKADSYHPAGTAGYGSLVSPSPASLFLVNSSAVTSEPRPGDTVHVKKENPIHDPYEFNAKVEDKIELPPKKLKLDKSDCMEAASSPPAPQPSPPPTPAASLAPASLTPAPPGISPPASAPQHCQKPVPEKRSVGVDVCSVGVLTEPDCLAPCEPGTLVGLEGIVWKETDNGLLVVNVTWRGKTYVGTLMDATRYAWAPPRPYGCDSPVSDFDSRTPKGRGKRNCRSSAPSIERLPEGRRLRHGRRGTVNSSSSTFTSPAKSDLNSPAKSELNSPAKSDLNSSAQLKRKPKPAESQADKSKRSRTCPRGQEASPQPDEFITCPEPNCQKKYKHMNGLRYHRTHAHRKSLLNEDMKDDGEEEEEEEELEDDKMDKTTVSERAERMKAKERQRIKEQQRTSDRDSKDSIDDDLPLKAIADKVNSSKSENSNICTKDKVTEDNSSSNLKNSNTFNKEGGDNQTISHISSATNTVDTFLEESVCAQIQPSSVTPSNSQLQPSSVTPSISQLQPSSVTPSISQLQPSSEIFQLQPSSMLSTIAQLQSATITATTPQVQFSTVTPTMCQLQSPTVTPTHSQLQPEDTVSQATTSVPSITTSPSITSSPTAAYTGVIKNNDFNSAELSSNGACYSSAVPTFSSTITAFSSAVLPMMTASSTSCDNSNGVTEDSKKSIESAATSQTAYVSHLASADGHTSAPHQTISWQTVPCPISTTSTLSSDRLAAHKGSSLSRSRLIVPALSPQAATSSQPLASSTQSHAHIHVSTLKPIQPKPTIMGDYSVSPSLSDLNRDKSRKTKKKKDKETLLSGQGTPQQTAPTACRQTSDFYQDRVSVEDTNKLDGSGTAAKSLIPARMPDEANLNNDLTRFPFQSTGDCLRLLMSNSPLTNISRSALPPSSLSLSTSPDNRNMVSNDVHSPAYSDISDANDSNSPIQQESPKKDCLKPEDQVNGPCPLSQDLNALPPHFANMFYFAGSPNYLHHGFNSHLASPKASKSLIKIEDGEDSRPSSSHETPPDKKDNLRSLQETPPDKKDNLRSLHEADIQQKAFVNYYSSLPGAGMQLQLSLAGYSNLAQVAEQTRLMQATGSTPEDGSGKRTPSSSCSSLLTTSTVGRSGLVAGYGLSAMTKFGTGNLETQLDQKRINEERNQVLREKLTDSIQVVPGNLEMKPHATFHPHHQMGLLTQDQQAYHLLRQQQQSEMLRAQIFQQQKQKALDIQRQDNKQRKVCLPESVGVAHVVASTTAGLPLRHSTEINRPELSSEFLKRETNNTDSTYDALDLPHFEVKEEKLHLGGSTDLAGKSRPSSNIPCTSTSSAGAVSLSSPAGIVSSALPASLSMVSSLPGGGASFPYPPYFSHFRPIQLDTMYRALNPHVLGYASPGYLHPAQLAFRMPPVEGLQKAADPPEPARAESGLRLQGPSPAAAHKVKELQDKSRPSPAPSSKTIGSESCASSSSSPGSGPDKVKDKPREYSSSPPTQRHVHTHHHTHVVGGFQPIYSPEAYSAMFGHPAAAAAAIPAAPFPAASHGSQTTQQ